MDIYDYAAIAFVLIFCAFGARAGLRKMREIDEINRNINRK